MRSEEDSHSFWINLFYSFFFSLICNGKPSSKICEKDKALNVVKTFKLCSNGIFCFYIKKFFFCNIPIYVLLLLIDAGVEVGQSFVVEQITPKSETEKGPFPWFWVMLLVILPTIQGILRTLGERIMLHTQVKMRAIITSAMYDKMFCNSHSL